MKTEDDLRWVFVILQGMNALFLVIVLIFVP